MNNFTLDSDDDTTLLIYSDWLEENGFLSIAEEIRIGIEGSVNGWHDEYLVSGWGVGSVGAAPGGFGGGGVGVAGVANNGENVGGDVGVAGVVNNGGVDVDNGGVGYYE